MKLLPVPKPGEMLALLAEDKGWNVTCLAAVLSTSSSRVEALISGLVLPDAEIANAVLQALGVDLGPFSGTRDLWDGDEEPVV